MPEAQNQSFSFAGWPVRVKEMLLKYEFQKRRRITLFEVTHEYWVLTVRTKVAGSR